MIMSITSVKKRSRTKLTSKKEATSKNIMDVGPLASTFPCSESRILDHMVTMKDYDYSISDIAKNSGVGFKTTLNIVHKLENQEVLTRTRNVGNAILYKLNSDSAQSKSISKLAFEIAKKRIRERI
jgi:hypothetical protein